MKILLVEDDQRIAKPLAEDLKHQRYVVDIAKDGIEGWEYSQSGWYISTAINVCANTPTLSGCTIW
jgi:DNA-binding response OmpR family regulator